MKKVTATFEIFLEKAQKQRLQFFVTSTLKVRFHLLPIYNELKSKSFYFNSALNFLPNIPLVFAFNDSEMNVDYPLQPYFLDQSYPY